MMKKNTIFECCLSVIAVLTFSSCNQVEDNLKLFPVKAGDKWGYVDKKGNFIINSQFDDAFNFSEDLALFKSSDGNYGFIDDDGKYAINPIYKNATKFSEGLACVVMENGKPQFINKEGNIVFTVDKAEGCFGFNDGMARIKVKGKWGFIDKTGKIIINPIYDDAKEFTEGFAPVAKIDEKTKEKKWGFIDRTGAVIINFQFIEDKQKFWCKPDNFKEGLAFVSSDGKQWGCIGIDGKYQINPQFEGADFNPYGFKNGVSIVLQGDSYGYIDKKGKYIINPQFKAANEFSSNGLAAVKHSDGKWGFINKEGRYEINPQFEEVVKGFVGDIAFVKSSDKYGIINKKGLFILNPQFDEAKIYDLNAIFYVNSDFIDNDEIAEQLFIKSSATKYLGYNNSTTLGSIIDEYPEISVDDLEKYDLTITKPDLTVTDIVKINSLDFHFEDKTYTETPIYKKVRKYDYWSGYYYENEIDRWDKKIQTTALLSYTALDFTLQLSGKSKGKALAEALKSQAIKTMKVTEIENLDINNSDSKGIYLLKSTDFFVFMYYRYDEDDENGKPDLNLIVINKNYETDFDELAKEIAKDFNDED